MTQNYRKGDVVTVKAVVALVHSEDGKIYLRPEGHYQDIFVDSDAVTMVQPYFAAGERVQKKSDKPEGSRRHTWTPIRGTVVAMSEDAVWVKFDNGKHGTVPAVELEPSTEAGGGLHVVAA
ncbi:hypothetical protein IB276_33235 [Ensifer sp. ENS04]|uniref:hypothetical protein n=1 Tax=Ensifer sp. ENS04 TaxID=2769281 RepID=UPI00177BD911|nr:hypothetical protein [Ensifer sp. ENS04]MBD9544312.1 hypothetical protein [Ensifer sp. ENS04]